MVGWIMNFLTNRSQCVGANGVFSTKLYCSTELPQGCVLLPLLFILYTNECRINHEHRHILKFADNTVIVNLLENYEIMHDSVVDDFITLCKDFHLPINVSKTKDMVIDFHKSQPSTRTLTSIQDQDVEIVTQYKYLGTIIDDRLNFESNTDAVCKKVQQCLFHLRKMNSFKVCWKLMTVFNQYFIESVLTYCMVAWFCSPSVQNAV